MRPLNWIKNPIESTPLVRSQLDGLTAMALMGLVVLAVAGFWHWRPSPAPQLLHADAQMGTIPVELAGETPLRGIYHVAEGTTVASFFLNLNLPLNSNTSRDLAASRLSPGASISLDGTGSIRMGDMGSAKRLALDLPVDVNTACLDDLILIPGIKEATAIKILELRRQSGGRFHRLEELLQIDGIKEKRLRKLQRHLFAGGSE